MQRPLADKIRPASLEDVVGQRHLLAPGAVLYNIIKTGNIPNMIFYGPSGTGKTTVANIAAASAKKKLYKLNATNASLADIKKIVDTLGGFDTMGGVLLYLDEIQNFNKKQQQSLLEFIENGQITLIASTTENPYFYIYNAILSRANVFEFKPLSPDDVENALLRAIETLRGEGVNIKFAPGALAHMAHSAGGDVRKALGFLELGMLSTPPNEKGEIVIDMEGVESFTSRRAMRYDKKGDSHYDVLSAFQKSIRGSDPDAAIHYLARLVEAGDLISICRRLMVIAAEDIGLAYPQAISIVKACVDCAFQLGFPEARITLAEAVLLLATAPKSNSAVTAIDAALRDVRSISTGDVPGHLKDAHYEGAKKLGRGLQYKYPHGFKNNYVPQQYLPDEIKDKKYYIPGENKYETAIEQYWNEIKENK